MADTYPDNLKARDAWNTNARFRDERMGEGNDFFNVLVWPAVERLLRPRRGARLLDIACGNGVASRRLVELGARVVAVDCAEELIALAREHRHGREIDYRVVDATDHDALVSLGEATFEGALCNMALMGLADLRALMLALARLLRPGGPFVFSVLHPCFNNPSTVQVAELEDCEGTLKTTYAVKVSRYLTSHTRMGAAVHGQPVPHPYFHRSLGALIGAGLDAGFVLDGLEERAFPPGHPGGTTPLSWSGGFSEIPPVLVARMRQAAG
ncbi:MAG TPA: class I SAM-dependent methyltransferase [Candidatus Methylomirabilis sp.]|nr:class I SAM-dependent methyltransferase [Candidatus Methylomirabilis sp.]